MDPLPEIHFDRWTLRRPSGELVRDDGLRIRLQSQPLVILEELLARPGELVTREQLIARLWPKGVVDFDTALNSAVRRLRTALGDQAETPLYIETIPRRGYRFIGRVESPATAPPASTGPAVASAEPAAVRPRRWPIAAAMLLVVLAGAAVLSSRVTIDQPAPGAAPVPGNAQAEERYQRARHFFQRRAPGDLQLASRYFQEAIAIDPNHARAWAGLAGAYWIETVEGQRPPELGLSKMRDAAEKALALDPGLAEAHLRLAAYRGTVGDGPERDAHLRKALELEPGNALVLSTLASEAAHDGRFDEAVELQQRAVEADPLAASNRYNLASMLYLAGRPAEAKAELLELRELTPAMHYGNSILGPVLVLERSFDEALALVEDWPDEVLRQQVQALAYHGLGRAAESDAALQALADSVRGEDAFLVAEVHAYRGEIDQAFDRLQAAAASAPVEPWLQGPRWRLWMMPYSPFLRPLHADPRWNAWLESTRARR
jgi:serine/threonine-protein kinase